MEKSAADKRLTWDAYFMKIAHVVAEMSTCDRAQVGTVLVRDRQILCSGFNGAPAGLDHCLDVGHLMVNGHCKRSVHSEINAIIQAALHGVITKGATCYVSHFPCLDCAKTLINAGIVRIVYANDYRVSGLAFEFLDKSNIKIDKLEVNYD